MNASANVAEKTPTLSPAWIVGFIGHRRGINESILAPVIESQLQGLIRGAAVLGGTLHFYSSVADGADLLALDCAEKLGLPLHVVLPVPEKDFVQAFPNEFDRQRALARLAWIRARPERHSIRLAATSMQLPEAYFEADTSIVEASDVMLVVWDGLREEGLGGTAQLVNLARNKRVPICWIHRDTAEPKPVPYDVVFRPDPVIETLAGIGIFRAALPSDPSPAAVAAELAKIKDRLSNCAKGESKWYRKTSAQFLFFNLVAATLGVLGGSLAHSTPGQRLVVLALGLVECVLLGLNLHFKYGRHRKAIRQQWIVARFAADLYRSLDAGKAIADPLHPLVAGQRAEVECPSQPDWRRFALSVGLGLDAGAVERGWHSLRDNQYAKRLSSQRAYFSTKGQEKTWLQWVARNMRRMILIIPTLALFAVGIRLAASMGGVLPVGQTLMSLILALLPLVISLPSAVLASLDIDRRAQRYPELARNLKDLQAELPAIQTAASLRRFVDRTEAMLLDELREWYFATGRSDPG